jgi:2-dehydropantoate 2-reductase
MIRKINMENIQKVVIFGAGAMGACMGASFFDAPGFSTAFLARGQRSEKLKQDGLLINGKPYFIPVVLPDEVGSPADFIVVALKHDQLVEAVHDLKNLVGPETTILSVMNGLESEELIGAIYGMDKLLYAISVGIDAQRVGNQVTYTKLGKIYFGEAKNPSISPKVARVQEAFDRAGVIHETPQDMIRMLWWKFMINVGMNQASAVTRAPYGVFQTAADAQALMEDLMQEVIVVAKAMGVSLDNQDITDWYHFLNMLSPQGKTSMLQDIEANRKTEVEIFGGKMVKLGKTHGIPTPVNQTMLRIIRTIENGFE